MEAKERKECGIERFKEIKRMSYALLRNEVSHSMAAAIARKERMTGKCGRDNKEEEEEEDGWTDNTKYAITKKYGELRAQPRFYTTRRPHSQSEDEISDLLWVCDAITRFNPVGGVHSYIQYRVYNTVPRYEYHLGSITTL